MGPVDAENGERRDNDAHRRALREAMRFPAETTRRYVASGHWQDDTLNGWLQRHAAARPEAVALLTPEGPLSFAAFADRVDGLARSFSSLGIGTGSVVAVQLPNLAAYLVCYCAILRLGAVMTTLYLPHRKAELASQLAHSRACAYIGLADIDGFAAARTVMDLAATLPHLRHVITVDGEEAGAKEAGAKETGALSLDQLIAAPGGSTLPPPPAAADPMLLLFTSGTTDRPKAVPLNAHGLIGNARTSVGEHRLSDQDVILSAAPFGHLFGLYAFHLAMAVGAATALLPAFSPPALRERLAADSVTALFAAPAHMSACLAGGLFDNGGLDHMRLIVLSGTAIPEAVARAVAAKMPSGALAQLWGMTETQAGLYTRPGDAIDVVARSAGRPSPGTEVRVTGPDGSVLGVGEEGELEVRGPLLFPGYYDNAEATAAAFTADGWFLSGDLATTDADGNVAITGRKKEIIDRGGVKYNPRDIETLIEAIDGVGQAAIVPMADPTLGERACCFVVLQPGAELDLADIQRHLSDQGVTKTRWPEALRIVDDMPMTPTRKVIKARLVALLANDRSTGH